MISKTFQYSLIGLSGITLINIGLAWQWILPPPLTSSPQLTTDNWRNWELPQPLNYQAFIDTIRQKKAWREPPPSVGLPPASNVPAAPVKPAEPPKPEIVRDWHLRGIVTEGKQRFALIIDKEQKIKRYAHLDILPDGSSIEKITDNSVEIIQHGTPEIICLYLQDMTKK